MSVKRLVYYVHGSGGNLTLLCLIAATLSLGGCATRMSPEQTDANARMFQAFIDAGCGGRVDIDAGASTGQLGGEAHAGLGLHGSCPERPPAPVTPSK